MRDLALTFFAAIALGTAGCAGGFSCSDRGPCASGTVPTDPEVSACEHVITGPDCGAPAKALLQCLRDDAVCDGAGNLDGPATLQKCGDAKSKLDDCCVAHADDPACS